MEILEITKEEYSKYVTKPFSKFETADFVELNKNKVDEVKYFVFDNGKKRFGFVCGIKDSILKAPFSSTYGIFSEITDNNRIEYYHEAVNSLIEYCKNKNIVSIYIGTPALSYGVESITKFQNALINNGFQIESYDVNFEYFTKNFDDNYLANIQRNARKNYNTAVRNELKFEKTEDIDNVYKIIKINREFRGFPLHMSLDDVVKTAKIIPSDYFIVTDKEGKGLASALIHHLKEDAVRVVYWGNTPESEEKRPINFLSYNIFKYYKEQKISLIDIGTSTVDGVPNFGLCDFKESIGCSCSPKINWILKLK